MSAAKTLAEWAGEHPITETPLHVVAACDGGCEYSGCVGWVITRRQSIEPYERVITDAERAEIGLPPDRWAHMNASLTDDIEWRVLLSSASATSSDDLFEPGSWTLVYGAIEKAAEIEWAQPGIIAYVLRSDADPAAFLRSQGLAY